MAVITGTATPPARWPSHILAASESAGSSSAGVGSGTRPASGGGRVSSGGRCSLIRGLRLAPAAEHLEPDLLLGHVGRVLAHDLALVHHQDPVRERQDLVELQRDQQDRAAFVALLHETAVEVLDRAHVEASGRLRGDQHLRVAGDLARRHDLLLVAAREPACARQRTAAAHVELPDQRAGALDEAVREEPAPLRVRRLLVVVQRDVLGDRELEHEAAPLAVLGDVADAGVEHPADARCRSRPGPRP